ncbi:tetratricopeptide repeat protein 19, mitochondrial isoform X2 [Thalassophryne amazonica]|uniref:tetratricopeptide repeat protein 19, mitochondrial isoform X2 n=1 Tax=Thalassophryne amazonica TaxID=390379 RepID=UPI001471F7FA|nr:tetratricopeptide repeat protein 19, mitochondrial isoform X2 [Thalassophryne amazonica]
MALFRIVGSMFRVSWTLRGSAALIPNRSLLSSLAAGGATGGGGGAAGRGALLAAVGFALFSSSDEDHQDEGQKNEDKIILLLKKAKLSVYGGELQAASAFLRQAVDLAQRTNHNQALIYTYNLMANLAFLQGDLDSAEKLFKETVGLMLSAGTPQDDNAIVSMSLKLAAIYAEQNKLEQAEHLFNHCAESLEAKLLKEQQKVPPEEQQDEQTELEQTLWKDTRLLLGMCLESRARYRASKGNLGDAEHDLGRALSICRQVKGEADPQTLVLMNDLATFLDLHRRHDEALTIFLQAVDLGRASSYSDLHVLLGNTAALLLHTARL